ncbi:hypothetical protein NQT62_04930 [Limnobacter humi]|uniref:Uncharacterized protein n=1 Tax=Limnobacter humi TaxID=1778671 RepID=A0ABT1WE35_9BURK|nr:hypothetical protein [Limnobacter humi]MCQ8895786.1 hypothetical protein [Limnobacter humi]
MIDIQQLAQMIQDLTAMSYARTDQQGLKIYQSILERLKLCQSDENARELHRLLCNALLGMEAHGFFQKDEWQIIERIRAL